MDHLKTIFEADLLSEDSTYVDNGRLHIRERHWSPDEVVNAFGSETYKEMFDNWLLEREEALLGKADEILVEYDQKDRFAMLKTAFQRGFVTPFVGAGLSVSSGYPSWTGFLMRLVRQTEIDQKEFSGLLRGGCYEEAAQLLADDLGVAFNEEIENTFGHERELSGPVQLLPYLFSSAVITTNFDSVLKRCYENVNRPFTETISGVDADDLRRFLATGVPLLVRVHGKAASGRGRVLTRKEYEIAYEQSGVIQDVVQAACGRTLLFMGCSLLVDRLLGAVANYVEKVGHDRLPRHYALVPAPPDETLRKRRRLDLAKCNIYPIWYPESEHDVSIEALLYLLADGVVEL